MADLPLQRFIDLIAVDQTINNVEQQITDSTVQIAKAEEELSFHTTALERIQLTTKNAKKQVDELELKLKDLDAQEKEKKVKLEAASNSVEYAALSKEIDHLKKQQNDLEEQVVQAWNAFEGVKKEFDEKKQQIEEHKKVIDARIQDLTQKIHEYSQQLQELNRQRPLKAQNLPEEWLEKYDIMKKQVSNPVVVVQQNSCSACFYKVPQQDLVALRKCKLLQCTDCYRFLYSDECFAKQEPE
jgi:predicted  nucleic acid-binding Zn-ribbon protein